MKKVTFYSTFILLIIALSMISFAQAENDPLKDIEEMSAQNWDLDKDVWKSGLISSIDHKTKTIVIDDIEYKISEIAKFTDNKNNDLSFFNFKKDNKVKFVLSGKNRGLIIKLIKP